MSAAGVLPTSGFAMLTWQGGNSRHIRILKCTWSTYNYIHIIKYPLAVQPLNNKVCFMKLDYITVYDEGPPIIKSITVINQFKNNRRQKIINYWLKIELLINISTFQTIQTNAESLYYHGMCLRCESQTWKDKGEGNQAVRGWIWIWRGIRHPVLLPQ